MLLFCVLHGPCFLKYDILFDEYTSLLVGLRSWTSLFIGANLREGNVSKARLLGNLNICIVPRNVSYNDVGDVLHDIEGDIIVHEEKVMDSNAVFLGAGNRGAHTRNSV